MFSRGRPTFPFCVTEAKDILVCRDIAFEGLSNVSSQIIYNTLTGWGSFFFFPQHRMGFVSHHSTSSHSSWVETTEAKPLAFGGGPSPYHYSGLPPCVENSRAMPSYFGLVLPASLLQSLQNGLTQSQNTKLPQSYGHINSLLRVCVVNNAIPMPFLGKKMCSLLK